MSFCAHSQYTTNSGVRWTGKKRVVVGYPLGKGGLLLARSASSQPVHRFRSANLDVLELRKAKRKSCYGIVQLGKPRWPSTTSQKGSEETWHSHFYSRFRVSRKCNKTRS